MPTTREKEEQELTGFDNDDLDRLWRGGPNDSDGNNRWGNGGDGDYRPGGYRPEPERTPPPEGYRIGIWLTLVSITMMFLALTSAYIVNSARVQPLATPRALFFSTAILLGSSATVELARRALKRRQDANFKLWLVATLVLGIAFLCSQLMAWRQLLADGFYINRNTHSGYAYIFTALHAVHLIGGLAALAYVIFRSPQSWTAVRRRVSMDAVAVYWHFLDGLWLYLLVIVFFWK